MSLALLSLLFASPARAFGEREAPLTWYTDLGFGLHLSWETPDPKAKAGFGSARLGPTFVLDGGADLALGVFRGLLGAHFETGKLPAGFFSGVDGGTFVELTPELRLGVFIVALSVAPHIGWLAGQDVSGYHIGLSTIGFRFRDAGQLGQAALIAFLPTWMEIAYDRYKLGDQAMTSMGIAFRWGL